MHSGDVALRFSIVFAVAGFITMAAGVYEIDRREKSSSETVTASLTETEQRVRTLSDQIRVGITGEVAEYEAARILGVELTPARQAGYDAIEKSNGTVRRLQIKGRCLLPGCRPGQRLGSIDREKDWDAVLMVLPDHNFDALEIHEASRNAVLGALSEPGSKARNERGALSVTKFRSIASVRWRRK
jgi:hypothetical protein